MSFRFRRISIGIASALSGFSCETVVVTSIAYRWRPILIVVRRLAVAKGSGILWSEVWFGCSGISLRFHPQRTVTMQRPHCQTLQVIVNRRDVLAPHCAVHA